MWTNCIVYVKNGKTIKIWTQVSVICCKNNNNTYTISQHWVTLFYISTFLFTPPVISFFILFLLPFFFLSRFCHHHYFFYCHHKATHRVSVYITSHVTSKYKLQIYEEWMVVRKDCITLVSVRIYIYIGCY